MNRLIILVLMASTFGMCSAKKAVTSKWEKAAYHDADSISFMDYKYNGKLLYLISNNEENLYIHAKVTDKEVQRMLLTFGLNIWIDTNGKGKKEMGIRYPLPMEKDTNNKGQKHGDKRSEESLETLRLQILDATNQLELVDFPDEPGEHIISTLNREYVIAHIDLNDKGEMNYTLQIPYKSIDLNYTPRMMISLSLESGKMPEQSRPSGQMSGSMGGGMSGGPGGGGNGGPGGGGGGGGRSGGMQGGGNSQSQSGGPNSSQESASVKIKIKHLELK